MHDQFVYHNVSSLIPVRFARLHRHAGKTRLNTLNIQKNEVSAYHFIN